MNNQNVNEIKEVILKSFCIIPCWKTEEQKREFVTELVKKVAITMKDHSFHLYMSHESVDQEKWYSLFKFDAAVVESVMLGTEFELKKYVEYLQDPEIQTRVVQEIMEDDRLKEREDIHMCKVSKDEMNEIRKELHRIAKLKTIGCPGEVLEMADQNEELDVEKAIVLFSRLVEHFLEKDIEWQDRCKIDVPMMLWQTVENSLAGICNEDNFEYLRGVFINPNISEEEKIETYRKFRNKDFMQALKNVFE